MYLSEERLPTRYQARKQAPFFRPMKCRSTSYRNHPHKLLFQRNSTEQITFQAACRASPFGHYRASTFCTRLRTDLTPIDQLPNQDGREQIEGVLVGDLPSVLGLWQAFLESSSLAWVFAELSTHWQPPHELVWASAGCWHQSQDWLMCSWRAIIRWLSPCCSRATICAASAGQINTDVYRSGQRLTTDW